MIFSRCFHVMQLSHWKIPNIFFHSSSTSIQFGTLQFIESFASFRKKPVLPFNQTSFKRYFSIRSCEANVLNNHCLNRTNNRNHGNELFRMFVQRQCFSNSVKSTKNEWEELLKLSLGKRLKVMLKKYWYVAIPLHFANCLLWFVMLFILCKCGINGAYVINFIKPYIVDSSYCPEIIRQSFEDDADKLGHVAVAILLYKIATPARYATTVFGSIYVLRYLLRKGVLVKTAEQQLKSMKKSYLTHTVSKNIEKQKLRFKKVLKDLKKGAPPGSSNKK